MSRYGPQKNIGNTLPCNGNFAFLVRFRSVLQFTVFLLLCQHFKSTAQRTVKERCEKRCENGTKKPVRKIITVQRTFKKQYVFASVPIGQMVFSATPSAEFYFSENVENVRKKFREKTVQ